MQNTWVILGICYDAVAIFNVKVFVLVKNCRILKRYKFFLRINNCSDNSFLNASGI